MLALEQHRRFVLRPFADDDDAVHRDRVQHHAHGIDRRLVGRFLLPPAHPAAGRQRRRLGDPHQLQRQIPADLLFHCTPHARVRRPPIDWLRLRSRLRASSRPTGKSTTLPTSTEHSGSDCRNVAP